ncbi:MAG: hypothetical protein H0T78_01655 [Longispora sp.]|nr:hypothetical protein [Longispora sp. (in: high G+C Gram-positive bacteria)]
MGSQPGKGAVSGEPATLAEAVDAVAGQLSPALAEYFRAEVPGAGEHVCHQVLAAAYTENIDGLRDRLRDVWGLVAWPVRGGGRVVFDGVRGPADMLRVSGPVWWEDGAQREHLTDPARLADVLLGGGDVGAELVNSAVNSAVAKCRLPVLAADALTVAGALGPDAGVLLLEQLSTAGHNVHPCGRTRLGMSISDVMRFDVGVEGVELPVVAVRRDVHVGDDVGALLGLPEAEPGYVLQPVHPW